MPKRPNYQRTFRLVLVVDLLVFAIVAALSWYESGPGEEFFSILAVAGGIAGMTLLVMWIFFRPLLRQQAIEKKGRPARARLVSYWDTGTTINDDPMVGMLVEVTPPDGHLFEAELKTLISRLEVDRLRPDANLYVYYDPNDPDKVAFHNFADPEEGETPATAPEAIDEQAARRSELEDLRRSGLITETAYLKRLKELEGKG